MDRRRLLSLAVIGLVAGVASGLFGVGGGIVMVPLLVIALSFEQHRAHATSLAAVVPIALVGAATFAIEGEVDVSVALCLAIGSLIGVPAGARLMRGAKEETLKIAFGTFMVVVGLLMVWP